MSHVMLIHGNALHIPLAEQSVHCIVTSPPYFGLRSYEGTTQWVGDEPTCRHAPADTPHRRGLATSTLGGGKATTGHQQEGYRDTCARCGAVRRDAQLGLETTHDCHGAFTGNDCGSCYICHMRQVFAECWRVLRNDGTMWINLGDSYANDAKWGGTTGGKHSAALHGEAIGRNKRQTELKPKNLMGIPWRLALALQQDGWILRSDIIWSKPNPMPESVQDRPTRSHEYLFLFAKQERYFYDNAAIAEALTPGVSPPGNRVAYVSGRPDGMTLRGNRAQEYLAQGSRNSRSVWSVATEPTPYAHFATMPTALVHKCIAAGTSAYGVCTACGTPYTRQVTKQRLLDGHIPVSGSFCQPTDPFRPPANGTGHNRYSTVRQEQGWQRQCSCTTTDVSSAIVLDPFVGSGTVPFVARELGRHSVGLDLSWLYLRDIARERLGLAALAAWEGRNGHHRPIAYADLPLFLFLHVRDLRPEEEAAP